MSTRSLRLFLLTLSLSAVVGCTTSEIKKDEKENQAFVLGSIHASLLNKPNYSLRDFMSAIDQFKPDLILTEVRTDRPGAMDGIIDGGIEQSLVYAYGNLANVPIIPIDGVDLKTPIPQLSAKQNAALKKRVAPLADQYRKRLATEDFLGMHSKETQNLIRKMYETYEKSGSTGSRIHNAKICENMKSSLALAQGKRVLVIFGIEHKYALEDCLRSQKAELVDAEDFFSKKTASSFAATDELKSGALTTIRASKLYLEQNLATGRIRGANRKAQEAKLESYPRWIEAISKL